jgi:hypothetical protein
MGSSSFSSICEFVTRSSTSVQRSSIRSIREAAVHEHGTLSNNRKRFFVISVHDLSDVEGTQMEKTFHDEYIDVDFGQLVNNASLA